MKSVQVPFQSREGDIRHLFKNSFLKDYCQTVHNIAGDNPSEIRIVDEFVLDWGKKRVDIAAIHNQWLHGFEIKSDTDNLNRLEGQVEIFSKFFDYMTLIVSSRHLDNALPILPKEWGVIVATTKINNIELSFFRQARQIIDKDLMLMLSVVWKEELIQILQCKMNIDINYKIRRLTCKELRRMLCDNLRQDVLEQSVRETLLLRQEWRKIKTLK